MPTIGGLVVPLILDTLGFAKGAEDAEKVLEDLSNNVQDVVGAIYAIDEAARESFGRLQAAADAVDIPVDQLVGSGSITAAMQEAEESVGAFSEAWDRLVTTVGGMTVTPIFAGMREMAADTLNSVTDSLQAYNDLWMGESSFAEFAQREEQAMSDFQESFGIRPLTDRQSAMSRMANAIRFAVPTATPVAQFLEQDVARPSSPSGAESVPDQLERERAARRQGVLEMRSQNRRAVQARIDR